MSESLAQVTGLQEAVHPIPRDKGMAHLDVKIDWHIVKREVYSQPDM